MNRICQVLFHDHVLNPAEAEVWITVVPEHRTPATEIRGRLVGPHCRYTSTVEVAYPLRSRHRQPEGLPGLTQRVVIPEPSLWEPQTPFLYQGPVELWQDGRCSDQVQVCHGLRRLSLGPSGLRVNGRLLRIHGTSRDHWTEEEALRLRQAGCNTLLVPVSATTAALWTEADRLGFLMLGRVTSPEGLARAEALRRHPSCFGWLLGQDQLKGPSVISAALGALADHGQFVGLELHHVPSEPLPQGIAFLAGEERLLSGLAQVGLPQLLLAKDRSGRGAAAQGNADAPGTLGGIYG